MIANPGLSEYVSNVYATKRPIVQRSVELLHVSCRLFAVYVGHPPTLRDLSDDTLDGFVRWLEASDRAPSTIKKHRGNILAIWRDAWRGRMLEHQPERIRMVRLDYTIPEAWTTDEI